MGTAQDWAFEKVRHLGWCLGFAVLAVAALVAGHSPALAATQTFKFTVDVVDESSGEHVASCGYLSVKYPTTDPGTESYTVSETVCSLSGVLVFPGLTDDVTYAPVVFSQPGGPQFQSTGYPDVPFDPYEGYDGLLDHLAVGRDQSVVMHVGPPPTLKVTVVDEVSGDRLASCGYLSVRFPLDDLGNETFSRTETVCSSSGDLIFGELRDDVTYLPVVFSHPDGPPIPETAYPNVPIPVDSMARVSLLDHFDSASRSSFTVGVRIGARVTGTLGIPAALNEATFSTVYFMHPSNGNPGASFDLDSWHQGELDVAVPAGSYKLFIRHPHAFFWWYGGATYAEGALLDLKAGSTTNLGTIGLTLQPDLPRTAQAPTTAPPPGDWLAQLNWYRAVAGLGPVVEDPAMTEASWWHARYNAENQVLHHFEDFTLPYSSTLGQIGNGNGCGCPSLTPAEMITVWMTAPYHGANMLDPNLERVGLGIYGNAAYLSMATPERPRPLTMWPGDGARIDLNTYPGGEVPDPADLCPGYQAPTGLGIIVLLPDDPDLANLTASIDGPSGTVENCVVDNYEEFFILPRSPLAEGQYTVSTSGLPGGDLVWSFEIVSKTEFKPAFDPGPSGAGGYWMLEADGYVYAFGDASDHGRAALAGSTTAVDIEPTPKGNGYWILDDSGQVHAFGDATGYGSARNLDSGERAVALASTQSGGGYWIFTTRGRVVTFGDATHHGDLPALGVDPVGEIIDAVSTGNGYYMLGNEGGVFSFGSANFWGSIQQYLNDHLEAIPATRWLNSPIVGLVPTPSGRGYWLLGADGGVFSFGDAWFVGSVPGVLPQGETLNAPVNGMVAYGNGYLMVASDGGVFNFSNKPFLGSLGANPPPNPVVALAPHPQWEGV